MTELFDPQIADDPEAFVMFAFPWGKANTPLHNKQGPRTWQRDELQAFAQHIKDNKIRTEMGMPQKVYRSATASGRGVGKSTLASWLINYMMTCRIGSTTIVTANTEEQLKTKTWGELGVWHTLSIVSHWFEMQALSMSPVGWFKESLKRYLLIDSRYYYAKAINWSEENPDAFAGAHNPRGVLTIFDEASGIHEKIWGIADGFFTESSDYHAFVAFSNPRRPSGAFFECFHKMRADWRTRKLDSRKAEVENPSTLEYIIRKYGEDSDEAKVEVQGEFPSQGANQFISRDVVDQARERQLVADPDAPLIMGVDPARFGDDKSVIRWRQGRNGRVIPAEKYKGWDNMQLANRVAFLIEKHDPDAICIDAGNGTGVIDRLREMGHRIHEVWFGSKSSQKEYFNKRTELWGDMGEWLLGAAIDTDQELRDDLLGPEYDFTGRSDLKMLESKEKMKSRGLSSPDDADALACTFAVNPPRRDSRHYRGKSRVRMAKDLDYNIFGD